MKSTKNHIATLAHSLPWLAEMLPPDLVHELRHFTNVHAPKKRMRKAVKVKRTPAKVLRFPR